MRGPLVLVTVGVVLVLLPIYVGYDQRGSHEEELRSVAALRSALDSTQLLLAAATTASDSARLTELVSSREYFLSRREYHVERQTTPRPFWRITGPAVILLTVGTVLVAIGVALLRRQRGA